MAKTVQPVAIELGIKGGEKLAALDRSFRDLSKQIKLSDADIIQATKDVAKFAQEAGSSEATIKGQIKAFEGLREQAAMGGKAYTALTQEISELKSTVRGSSTAVEAKRKSLVELGSSANATAAQIQDVIQRLTALRGETRLDSDAFNSFGQSIDKLAQRFEKLNQEAQDLASAQARSGRVISASSGAAKQQIRDLDLVTQALREQREELGRLEGEARIRRGVADLADRGAASSSRRSYQEALAESVLSGTAEDVAGTEASLKKLLSTKDIRAALAEVELQIAEFQKQVESNLSRGLQISFQETSRAARESARAMAAAFADPELLGILDRLDQRIGELPNTTAGFNQRLRELQQQLANTARDSDAYVSVSLEIARVQREAAAATQGLGAALVRDLNTGVAARSSKNLREAIGQLQAEMSELNTETTEGSAKYAENARQVNNLQKELDQIANSYRNVADMTRQATVSQVNYEAVARKMYLQRDQPGYKTPAEIRGRQFLERIDAEGQVLRQTLALPAAGQTSAPGTGAAMSGMARRGLPYDIDPQTGQRVLRSGAAETTRRPLAPADLPRDYLERSRAILAAAPSAAVGVAPGVGFGEQVIKKQVSALREAAAAYRPYNKAIRDARAANNNSISSINNLKNALIAKRNEVPNTSAAFRRLTSEIENLDRKSERVSRRMRGRRMSAGQFAQAAGATISGGIFGGPEGFLGGAIGTAFGRAGGAFAGAAIGAQIGGLRREVGGYAEYAAQIEKLKIALEGISGAQEEYNRALEAANSATNDLNVPQEVAIRGITRLTAAVKGAGGGVADAELAFKNINSAIIATGGGAEQVEGAVTALVQIFSKGKVSAEEINQIAERLPGTFNKIAEASGRTGPQLTKALQDGEVGLNDLMKFLVELGDEYGLLAQKIADSSESAGARLQVAYDKMRQEVGKALQPIGAEFQDAFTEFLTDIAPALIDAAKAVGDGLKFILDNREAITVAASFALKLTAVNLALKAFTALSGPLSAMFALLKAGFTATSQQATLAKTRLATFGATAKALAVSLAAPIVITFAVIGAEQVIAYFNRIKKARADLEATAKKPQGEVFFRSIGGSAATKQTLQRNINDITKNLDILRDRVKSTKEQLRSLEEATDITYGGGGGGIAVQNVDEKSREDLKTRLQADEAEVKRLALNYKTLIDKYLAAPDAAAGLTNFSAPGAEGEGGDGGASKQKKQRKSQLESIRNGEKLLDIELMLLENSREIGRAQFENNFARVSELNNQKISLEFAKQAAQNEFEYRDAVAQAIGDENQAAIIQEAALKREIQDKLLLIQYEGALSDEAQRRALEQKAAAKASQDELFSLRERLGLVSDQERISRYRTNLEEQGTPNADELTDLYRQTVDPTFAEGISQNIRALKKDLEELLDPINQVTGAANAIGTAFTDSFMSAITGSATAQEALANFFSNTAKFFLDMAAQIIQKMITMAILNQVVGLLPGGNVGGGGGGDIFADIAARGGLRMKNGGAFDKGGLVPFAMGGIVDKPTMFAYANGGVGRFGIMGEAGPEAILPLQRGPGGKLGVQASGSSVGDVVVNVDASGTRAQGDNQSASQLGNVIGAAVQAELIKQKRPGGLLA